MSDLLELMDNGSADAEDDFLLVIDTLSVLRKAIRETNSYKGNGPAIGSDDWGAFTTGLMELQELQDKSPGKINPDYIKAISKMIFTIDVHPGGLESFRSYLTESSQQ